jgi:hypothetical protein
MARRLTTTIKGVTPFPSSIFCSRMVLPWLRSVAIPQGIPVYQLDEHFQKGISRP